MPPNTVPLQHPIPLPTGFRLEEYRIMQVLSQGGFGITYLAEDTRMNVEVAIKELFPKAFVTRHEDYSVVPLRQCDEEDLARAKRDFIERARARGRLFHPNILTFLACLQLNGTAYLVIEFVRGQNLRDWLKTHHQPGEEEVKDLLWPLLCALEYLHQQGLLHGQISPENVMIAKSGRPVFLNLITPAAPKTITLWHGFSPIEQYQRSDSQGPCADLYALAGIMIQAITGETPPQALDRVGSHDPYEPLTRRFAGKYSLGFLQAFDAAFAVLPKDRPQSVEQWRRLLEQIPFEKKYVLGSAAHH